jgi:ATP-binding cassette, subfamily B, bacterial MsbA
MSFKKLLLRFVRQYPGWIGLTIILSFSGALFNGVSTALIVPVLLDFLGQTVNLKGAPPVIQFLIAPFDGLPQSYRLAVMAGAILLAIILKNLTTYASTLVSSSLARSLTADLREAGLRLLLEVDMDYYAKMKIGDIMNRLGGEIGRTTGAISSVIGMVSNAITVFVFIGLLLWISWQLTIISTGLLALVMLANQYSIHRAKHFGKELSEMSKNYSVKVFEALSGIRLVKATGNEDREYQIITKLIRDREKADFQSQANYAAIGPVNEVTSIVALLMIVILGRMFFATQITSLSTVLLTYLLVLFRTLPLISALNNARSKFANSAASVEVVGDLLRRDNKPIMGNGSIPYTHLKKEIRFNQISFRYPDHENWVLRDVTLQLPQGTTLALVGASGAGKSTIADLLPRFYDPTSGSITIDGTDLREFDMKTLRRSMGIVSQETFLFNDSVRNNIAYARLDATDEEIIAAAKRANAYEFIERLPQGLQTMIGDRGVLLSGGQRQRIAIARALLQDPEILILDEATSALDTVSERLVQEAIDALSNDRTTLVIAHRLSTVQKAHQIAVLDKGVVVEVGTHNELLKQNGYYARLYDMQFSDQPQKSSDPIYNNKISKTSYEIRTRLNAMLGSLRLLIDGVLDSPEEEAELTNEAYFSAIRLLETLETLEHSAKSK